MPENRPAEMPRDLTTRSLSLRLSSDGRPTSLDEKTRSVEVVCTTEAPTEVWDWERYEVVREVLLMSGCQVPESRQVPLLDSHMRWSTADVFGSARDLRVDGDKLVGRAHYSEDEGADKAWRKTREGHLTDYSIGYRVTEAFWIPEGEKQTILGRTFDGPLKVATQWKVRELSTCPIGADEFAKARAATQPDNPNREERTMPDKDKNNVEDPGRGTQQPTAQVSNPEPPHGLSAEDVARTAQMAARNERARVEEIRSLCGHYGYDDLARELIDGEKGIEEARKAVLERQMSEAPTTGGIGFRAHVVADERDKFRGAASDSLLLRAGLAIEKPAAGAVDLRGYSLRELAREALRYAGQPTSGSPLEMVGRALTTSDFPILLSNLANKSLFEGWETADETWSTWCATGSVSDFKTHTSARVGETDDLDEVPADTEYKYGKRSEAKEEYAIATYGKLFAINRQAIINDDLGALTDIPRAHGEAAARKVGDIAYAVLTANAAMGDGVALFAAGHGNLGTGAAVSETTVGEAIKLMKLQKDLGGKRRLNIRPQFFIAPVALEGAAEVFFGSNQFTSGTAGSTRANPYAGTRFSRVYEPRLDDDSASAYYFAGPKGKTVRVFFLNGNQTPYLEMKQGYSVDGVEYKVRIDAGAKAMDWKGLVKNAGA